MDVTIRETSPEDLDAPLVAFLGQHSVTTRNVFDPDFLGFGIFRDEALIAGLTAQFTFGWLWIKLLAVDPSARGQGLGAALMAHAEQWARARNAIGLHVDTYRFQAPAFYEKLGYRRVSILQGPIAAQDRLYYEKRCDGSG